MSRHNPAALGRCTRWFPKRERLCNKSARYSVYDGNQELCKECYVAWRAGRELLFLSGKPPTVAQRWAFRQRLEADVTER
jgi:hypothetical protein